MDLNQVLKNISDRQQDVAALTEIERPLEIDLGNLTVWDPDSIILLKEGVNREEYFKNLTRDDVQIVLNKLYSMDTELNDGQRVVKLPDPTTRIPRAKPVPKPKAPTKWEKFAREKGIKNRRDDKKVWDEATKRWVPRYGYQRSKNDDEKDWVIEVPDQADPNVDYFAKRSEDKRERVAKNKWQQLRNVARSQS